MDTFDLADKFIAALEAGDEATVRQCYSEDAVIWHNFDRVEQTVDINVASLHWLRRTLDNISYQIVRRERLPDGFLQQHVLTGTLKDGSKMEMPACVVFKVENDRIVRLEEYLDPTPITQAMAHA